MESINNVLNNIRPKCIQASIDLKYTFFSVPTDHNHQKYLKFTFDDLFQFMCMPNGYAPTVRVFTKIPFGHFRSLSHNSLVYVDDSYLQEKTYRACFDNISDSINLLRELGFLNKIEKSVITP